MNYRALFDLSIAHSYYADGLCSDFLIIPTAASEARLRQHHCIIKPYSNGLRILTATTENKAPFVPIQDPTTLVFYLQLKKPEFVLFTDLTQQKQHPAPFYTLKIQSPSSPILNSRTESKTETFTVIHPATKESFVLADTPRAGIQKSDFMVIGLGAVTSISSFDPLTKVIMLKTSAAHVGDQITVSYEKAGQLASGIFAEVEIQLNGLSNPIENSIHFSLGFQAAQAHWRYYLVTEPNIDFSIQDTNNSPINFGTRTNLSTTPDTSDDIGATLASRYSNMAIWRFVSDAQVPYRQEARGNIQLKHSNAVVIQHLPNPSPQSFMMTLSGTPANPQKVIALYQVVRHFSQASI